MDNILEWLGPVIFFIVWVASILFKQATKERDNTGEDAPRPMTPLDHPANDEDDRTRRIQEEIRRKIAARRSGTPTQPAPPEYNPYQPEQRQAPQAAPAQAPRPMIARPEPQFQQATPPPVTSRAQPAQPRRSLQEELAFQRERVDETERQASNARHLARRQEQTNQYDERQRKARAHYTGSLRATLKRELRDPNAVRRAFLHYEILGTPVGLRRDGQLYPHWKV